MPSGAGLEGRGSPLQPKSAGRLVSEEEEEERSLINRSCGSSRSRRGTPDSLSRGAGTGLQSPGGPDDGNE